MSTVHIIRHDDTVLTKVEDRFVFNTVNELNEFFYTCDLNEDEGAYCHEDNSLYVISRSRLACRCKGEIIKSIERDN